jgi:acetyl esterase
LGDLETHDTLCRHLAQSSQVAIAAVDYRRAPEHPFPIPLEDCEDALRYLVTHAAQFKIDPDRLALAGDSAGGNLAAAVCCKVHEEGGPSVRLQLLVYPVISAGCDTPSYESFAEGYGLTGDEMRWFWRAYLGGATEPPSLASLDLRRPPSNLPFTRILTAEYDVLRDEAERYAATLKEAGIEVELSRHEGLIHGFFHFCGAMDRGRELVQSTGEWLGQQLRKAGEDPPLSREAQMAKFEEALKNDDWGHQPC